MELVSFELLVSRQVFGRKYLSKLECALAGQRHVDFTEHTREVDHRKQLLLDREKKKKKKDASCGFSRRIISRERNYHGIHVLVFLTNFQSVLLRIFWRLEEKGQIYSSIFKSS